MRNKILYGYLLLALSFAGLQCADAQITITKANMPTAGESIIYSTSNDSIDVSATGADTTWDFSKITPVSQDTYKYVTAKTAGALDGLTFTGDVGLNVKTDGFSGAYQFFKTSAAQYTMAGLGITVPMLPIPITIVYTSPDVIYRFPLSYGSKDSASFSALTPILSIDTIKISGKRTNVVDGWGKVITPYKMYNCIRVRSVVKEIDTILGAAVDNSRIEYKWLSTSEQIPVFEVVVTKGVAGAGPTQAITYRDSFKNVVNPNGPVVGFNVPDTNVFTKDTVTFNNTTTGAITYSWIITPATYTYPTGSTNTSKNPKVIFNTPGLYTISLNATGIGGTNYLTKTHYINATHNSGIEPVSNAINELQLYPNPSSGDVQINMGGHLNRSVLYSVINTSGKAVYSGMMTVNNGLSNISLKDCAPGLYLVRIQNEGRVFEVRVVRE